MFTLAVLFKKNPVKQLSITPPGQVFALEGQATHTPFYASNPGLQLVA